MEYDTTMDDDSRYTDLVNFLNSLMGDNTDFRVKTQDQGWRDKTMTSTLSYGDAEELIQEITPNTAVVIEVKSVDTDEGVFEVTLSHHDSPEGETYTFTPV